MTKPGEKTTPAKPASSGKGGWVALVVVTLAAAAGGGLMPPLLLRGGNAPSTPAPAAHTREKAYVPFGDDEKKTRTIVANLRAPNQNRYLKLSIMLVTDKGEETHLKELLHKHSAVLRNALFSYLADRTVDDIRGTAGINRVRRELLDQFNILLYPDGTEKIRDLLFDDFTTQM